MRRLGAVGAAMLLVLAGCSSGPQRPEPPKYLLVSYTVESLSPNYHGYVDIRYTGTDGNTVDLRSVQDFRSWGRDQRMWHTYAPGLTATLPDQIIKMNPEYKLRCTIAVNGLVVSTNESTSHCFANSSILNFTGPASAPATLSPRPPETWPPFTTGPARKPTPTPEKPRPDQCRFATDAEIIDAIGPAVTPGWEFKGVTVGMNGGCLYRFGPVIPGGFHDPLSGVTVAFHPGRVEPGPDDEPIAGLAPARRSTDSVVYANLPRGNLMVVAQFPQRTTMRTVSEAVYKLVRSRV